MKTEVWLTRVRLRCQCQWLVFLLLIKCNDMNFSVLLFPWYTHTLHDLLLKPTQPSYGVVSLCLCSAARCRCKRCKQTKVGWPDWAGDLAQSGHPADHSDMHPASRRHHRPDPAGVVHHRPDPGNRKEDLPGRKNTFSQVSMENTSPKHLCPNCSKTNNQIK